MQLVGAVYVFFFSIVVASWSTDIYVPLLDPISGRSLLCEREIGTDVKAKVRFLRDDVVTNLDKEALDDPSKATPFQDLKDVSYSQDVHIHDVRGKEDEFNLDGNGFTYVKYVVEGRKDGQSIDEIQSLYEGAALDVVKKL